MLQALSLSKRYGDTLALDALDLNVQPGEVFCLLGPNGAGKTTTVNLFLGFTTPSTGQALVCGIDSNADPLGARRQLAYIPENVMLYGKLSGVENLRYFVALATSEEPTVAEAEGLLLRAGLPAAAQHRRVAGYSKGMRQKVGIAVAWAKNARVLLLDEPTSGLDPLAANEFAAAIHALRAEGLAILMVTHDLFLAQQCGSRVGIMQQGRLVQVLQTAHTDAAMLEGAYLNASRLKEAA